MTDVQPATHWTIDKRIPLALLVTIVLTFMGQTIAVVTWVTNISGRVSVLEQISAIATPSAASRENRLVRLETITEIVQKKLDTIDNKLDRLIRERTTP